MTTAFSMIGKATASMSFTMAYIVSAEVYPTEVRNWGMGTSSVCARISGMAAPYVGDALVSKFLIYSFYSRCCRKRSLKIKCIFNERELSWQNYVNSGNFSTQFWRQCVSLFASIAAIVSLLLPSDKKSFRCN